MRQNYGLTVAQATTAALLARASTGKGQHIDISMLQANLAFMWPDGMMDKTIEDRDGIVDMSPISDYYQTLDVSDGSIALAPLRTITLRLSWKCWAIPNFLKIRVSIPWAGG